MEMDKFWHALGGAGGMAALLFLGEVHWVFYVAAVIFMAFPIGWELITRRTIDYEGLRDIRFTWFGMGAGALVYLAYLFAA